MSKTRKWMMGVVCVVLMAPVAMAGIVCGVTSVQYIMDEPDPVDINCVAGTVVVYNATANLVAGGEVTDIQVYPGSTVNISGGTIAGGDYGLNFVSGAFVTVYAASAEVATETVTDGQAATTNDIDQLNITDSFIHNTGPSTVWFDLIGTYQDQTPFIIPCALETDAVLGINILQSLPEIDVTPALLTWDLGDIPIGESAMQLLVIYNLGAGDLNVSSVTLSGSEDFAITGPATPLVIAPNSSIGVDFEITYTPSSRGPASSVVTIVSDDGDESVIEVTFNGVGIVIVIPPSQQIQDILDYFDASVADGTLVGYGPGNSASKRLKALRNMIESASDLINAGDYAQAIDQLESIAKKTDGVSKPQDFVVGDSAAVLNTMITDLIADLAS
jgi:hypothetical protein